MDAEQRRKQKESYLAALSAQKVSVPVVENGGGQQQQQQGNGGGNWKPQPPAQDTSVRDQRWEQRRQKFLAKQAEVGGQGNSDPEYQQQQNNEVTFTLSQNTLALQQQPLWAAQVRQEQHEQVEHAYQAQPHKAQVNPRDWQKEGYPSEYAYMQANGGLDVPRNQVKQVEDNQNQNQMMPFGGGGGGEDMDVVMKRERQADYARDLQQQMQVKEAAPRSIGNSLPGGGALGGNGNGGFGGNGLSTGEQHRLKEDKQRQYAEDLRQQAQHKQQERQQQQPEYAGKGQGKGNAPAHGDPLSFFGGDNNNANANDDAKAQKRMKQAQYADDLAIDLARQQQQNQQQQNQQNADNRSNNNKNNINNNNRELTGGGALRGFGGQTVDDARRERKAEYGQELAQQANQDRLLKEQERDMDRQLYGGGGDSQENAKKQAKKAQQEQYKRDLEMDQWQKQPKPDSAYMAGGGGCKV